MILGCPTEVDTLGILRDCSGLWMVHDERDPAVESFDSTVMLDPIPGTWSPGDEPGDPVSRTKATLLPVHHVH